MRSPVISDGRVAAARLVADPLLAGIRAILLKVRVRRRGLRSFVTFAVHVWELGVGSSPLTHGTIESRTSSLHDPLDSARASTAQAALPFSVVDEEGIMRAGAVLVPDRGLQHCSNRTDQFDQCGTRLSR